MFNIPSITLYPALKFEANVVCYIPRIGRDAEQALLRETDAVQAIFAFPLLPDLGHTVIVEKVISTLIKSP